MTTRLSRVAGSEHVLHVFKLRKRRGGKGASLGDTELQHTSLSGSDVYFLKSVGKSMHLGWHADRTLLAASCHSGRRKDGGVREREKGRAGER